MTTEWPHALGDALLSLAAGEVVLSWWRDAEASAPGGVEERRATLRPDMALDEAIAKSIAAGRDVLQGTEEGSLGRALRRSLAREPDGNAVAKALDELTTRLPRARCRVLLHSEPGATGEALPWEAYLPDGEGSAPFLDRRARLVRVAEVDVASPRAPLRREFDERLRVLVVVGDLEQGSVLATTHSYDETLRAVGDLVDVLGDRLGPLCEVHVVGPRTLLNAAPDRVVVHPIESVEELELPIHVTLQTVIDSGLRSLLARDTPQTTIDAVRVLDPFLSEKRLRRAIVSGRLVLLLDGLDEVSDRAKALERIARLHAEAGDGVVVVAARKVGHTRVHDDFVPLRVLGLDKREKKHRLACNWYAQLRARPTDADARSELARHETPEAAADALLIAIGRARLVELTRNPLMLTLAALLFAEDGAPALSARRHELFARIVTFVLESRHRDRGRRLTVDEVAAARPLLARLALWMTEQGKPVLRVDSVASGDADAFLGWLHTHDAAALDGWREAFAVGVAPALARAGLRKFFERVQAAAGLFVRASGGVGPESWRFPIQPFRDALAAEALVAGGAANVAVLLQTVRTATGGLFAPSCPKETRDEALPRWAEALALVAGHLRGEDALTAWLIGLLDINAKLGLRALANVDDPPAQALDRLLSTGANDAEERERYWLGLLERARDAGACARLLERVAPRAEQPVDRWAIAEFARALASDREHGDVARRARAAAVAPRKRIDVAKVAAAFARVPRRDEPMWKRIEPGRFRMGDQRLEVEVAHPFWIMATTVTVAHLRAIGGQSLAKHRADDEPAIVNWYDAAVVSARLDAQRTQLLEMWGLHGVPEHYVFRLPTEREWEYACRAGTETTYWSGDHERDLARVGWYEVNSDNRRHPVAELPANPWGLYDVHGNVWQWCHDRWSDESSVGEPFCAGARVLRGGSYGIVAGGCRSAVRFGGPPGVRPWLDVLGFRVALSVPPPASGIEHRS